MSTDFDALDFLISKLQWDTNAQQMRLFRTTKCVVNNVHMMLYLPGHGSRGVFYTLDKRNYRIKLHLLTKENLAHELNSISSPPDEFTTQSRLSANHLDSIEASFFNYTPKLLTELDKYQWFLEKHPEFKYRRNESLAPGWSDGKTDIVINKSEIRVNGQVISFAVFYRTQTIIETPVHEIEQYRVAEYDERGGRRLYRTKHFTILTNGLNVSWFNKTHLTQGKFKCKDQTVLNGWLSDIITFDYIAPLAPPITPSATFPKEIIDYFIGKMGDIPLVKERVTLNRLKECLDLMVGYKIRRSGEDGCFSVGVSGFSIIFDVNGFIYFNIPSLLNVKIVSTELGKSIHWSTDKRTSQRCYDSGKYFKTLRALHHKTVI